MKRYLADLHIHTVLSPCGSLEMSPKNIVDAAIKAKLDIIAITDHNSTKQAPIIKEIASEQGLFVLLGAEVNTKEEVHCLALFEKEEQRINFQQYLDQYLMKVKNDPDKFGYQVVVDKEEMIVEEEENLLIFSIDQSIHEVEQKVHELDGLFIPAHIDRPMNGIFSHLGFVPESLKCDAFGLSGLGDYNRWKQKIGENKILLRNSDAHHIEQIGAAKNKFEMEAISFEEIKMALKGINGRKVIVE